MVEPQPKPPSNGEDVTVAGSPAERPVPEGGLQQLGHYRILGPLGHGGMGVVYKAYHAGLDRTYALKVLSFAQVAGTPQPADPVERFLREARAVARIGKHPNIVQVHDVGHEGTHYYFAMDLVDGEPLDWRINEKPLPPREAAAIARDVARAIQVAHEAGIVHRDLKPSNVLLTKEGVPQVSDFGLARDVRDVRKLSSEGQILGTLQYMAPEQAEGDTARMGPATDVYGIGATLYEMLTGRAPYAGETQLEILAKVLEADSPPARKVNPSVPIDLETICEKAMQRDPTRRYAGAKALAEDLDRFLVGDPILARPISSITRIAWKISRHRRVVLPIAAAAAIAAGFGAWAWVQSRGASDDRTARAQAEASERGAREALEKSSRAQTVLARWTALAGAVRAMEVVRWDSTLSIDERRSQGAEAWKQVEEFVAETPRDPSSQATMRALAGWARRLAGWDEEGTAWMREASRIDPALPYGALMEALGCFSEYIARLELPRTTYGVDGLLFGPPAPETAEMRGLREDMERLLDQAAAARVWGGGLAADFRAAIDALRAVQAGRYQEAEQGLSAAMGAPAMQFFRNDLLLARSQARYLAKRFEEALSDLEKLEGARPRQAEVHYYEGMAHSGVGAERIAREESPIPAYGRAVKAFNKALKLSPSLVAAHTNRGIALVGIGETEKRRGEDPRSALESGIEAYEEAIRLAPDLVEAWNNSGNALTYLGDARGERGIDPRETYDRAIERLGRAIAMDPDLSDARNNRGIAQKNRADADAARGGDPREQYAKAIADFDAALEKEPGHPHARINRGVSRVRLGDAHAARGEDPVPSYEEALLDLDESVRRDGSSFLAHMDRGNALEALAKWKLNRGEEVGELHERAISDYGEAVRLRPGHSDAWMCRGLAWMAKANALEARREDGRECLQKAIAEFDESIRLKADAPRAWGNRGLAWKGMGDEVLKAGGDPMEAWKKAIDDYDAAVRCNASFAEAFMNRASVWLSIAQFQASSSKDPREAGDRAIADLDSSIAIDASDWMTWNNRGAAKLQRGEHGASMGQNPKAYREGALADFAESLARNPANWMARANRGMLYEVLGRPDEAAVEYEEGLKHAPGQRLLRERLDAVRRGGTPRK